jgi:LysM repeat protein
LGCHSKQSRIRVARRLPAVAAPALAGVAAAFCLAPQALADPSAAHQATHQAVVADPASRLGPSSAQLLSAIEQATQHQATQHQAARHATSSGQASWYTVRSGDSLSAIAERAYHDQDAWPVLYWANRSTIHWADMIQPGQVLRIPVKPARIPDPPAALGPAPDPTTETSAPSASVSDSPAPAEAEGTADVSPSGESAGDSASGYTGGQPGGSFGQCVIARESGGQSQVMNASGHYGLYQFSASTWAAYGGSPADFGDASVAEQNQVFANALADGGQSNWSAYDGC